MFHTKRFGELPYKGKESWEHTRRQMEKLRSRRVEIISYFVDDKVFENSKRQNESITAFKLMYGRDSHVIDTESITDIASVINQKVMRVEEI